MFERCWPAVVALPLVALASTASAQQPEETVTREEAIAALETGEAMLDDPNTLADGMTLMLVAYLALEQLEGAEAAGVVELRSWLVKALDTAGLASEASDLRSRGSYVDHPLNIMPSTWFKTKPGGGTSSSTMSASDAEAAVERGLGLLEQGNVDGLGLLIDAYDVIERERGPESEDAIVLRSFLVGLLDAGGFTNEAALLRSRGSVMPASEQDTQVYAATWLRILEAESSAANKLSGLSASGLKVPAKGTTPTTTTTTTTTTDPGTSGGDTPAPEPEPEPDKPKVVEKGSPVPGVRIDLGLGSFQPEIGRKGMMWTLGFEARWTLFRAKFFGMEIGGGGAFGRNREKRWLAEAQGSLGLDFDFQKLYITPEFGGGYDGIAGGTLDPMTALRVNHAGFYMFGGTLGVRFAEKYGLYGRALRYNRFDEFIPNETRIRGGFLFQFADRGALDLAFVFTDYDSAEGQPGARFYSGVLGLRF